MERPARISGNVGGMARMESEAGFVADVSGRTLLSPGKSRSHAEKLGSNHRPDSGINSLNGFRAFTPDQFRLQNDLRAFTPDQFPDLPGSEHKDGHNEKDGDHDRRRSDHHSDDRTSG